MSARRRRLRERPAGGVESLAQEREPAQAPAYAGVPPQPPPQAAGLASARVGAGDGAVADTNGSFPTERLESAWRLGNPAPDRELPSVLDRVAASRAPSRRRVLAGCDRGQTTETFALQPDVLRQQRRPQLEQLTGTLARARPGSSSAARCRAATFRAFAVARRVQQRATRRSGVHDRTFPIMTTAAAGPYRTRLGQLPAELT